MAKKYPQVDSNPHFPAIEQQVLSSWQEQAVFKQSVENNKANDEFVFYDGPPFANGLPHYGHLLTGYVKDLFARYQTMQGKLVERKFGWDCHGLPAEMGAEKELAISGRKAIEDFGIDKFNAHCRQSVMKYANDWEQYVTRQARWVEFEGSYKTMDSSYMESVIGAFKVLDDKGLVYQDMRVMPYSWAAQTPLSNFETRLDNSYREKKSKAVTVGFKLSNGDKILAWTTTPWTLPSNLALGIGTEIEYAKVNGYIIAKSSVGKYAKELGLEEGYDQNSFEIIKGSDLVGHSYEPLFPYFADTENAFKIIAASFVEEGDGTGIVHLAPGFGEDDFDICKQHNIPVVCPVDDGGKFTNQVPDYEGKQVFETNEPIIIALKEQGSWLKTEQYIHNYPHCWRTDEPLIYKAVPSWYVEVTKFKDDMVKLNQNINWQPSHVKDGLFGKWLENARDWSISRNRFWGAPIPIWVNVNDASDRLSFGSIAEIEAAYGKEIEAPTAEDKLHRPYIDITIEQNGKSYKRVTDVFDCWFESGSMPYASVGFNPHLNKGQTPQRFPADFIVEYTAQTRGWFYTMMVLSTALFNKEPFTNCICHGVVLDAKGEKLSKRLQNYPDPLKLFEEYGADALRWFMMRSPIMRGQELYIDKEGKFIRDCVRLYIKPIWNAYNFFCLYANADEIEAKEITSSSNIMDSWILAELNNCTLAVNNALDSYDTPTACTAIEDFFEQLNNWYLRRTKERFWKKAKDEDKQAAYDTVYTVLNTVCCLTAPLLPLVSEKIYSSLTGKSVHLASFPSAKASTAASNAMRRTRAVCNTARSIRDDVKCRVRQPLLTATIYCKDLPENNQELDDIIKDEINVKTVIYQKLDSKIGTEKLNIVSSVLGKRLKEEGKQAMMKDIIIASKQGKWEKTPEGYKLAGEVLNQEEASIALETNLQGAAAIEGGWGIVALDINYQENPELVGEGVARDIVRLVQDARKKADLDISDKIKLKLNVSESLLTKLNGWPQFNSYIEAQTLSSLELIDQDAAGQHSFEEAIDGQRVAIVIG